MRFFIDHCVPEDVAKFLEARGHDVVRLRDVIPTDSPDPMVAREAERDGAVLVSHDGDFKNISPRIPLGQRSRFRKLSRIHMDCKKTRSVERMAAAIALIEFEYDGAQSRTDKRLHVTVQTNLIKTLR